MPRIKSVEPNEATGEVGEIYQSLEKQFGKVFNQFKAMGASPVALKAYVTLQDLISEGSLSPVEQETVRLITSQYNSCKYCTAAHTKVLEMHKLDEEETINIRQGTSAEEKRAALVAFTHTLLMKKGFASDDELKSFYDAGYTNDDIGVVITIIGQKMISNHFNNLNDTELDFPKAPELKAEKAMR